MRLLLLSALTMFAFAANSLFCRIALKHSGMDAASFTSIRLLAGALVLWLVVCWRGGAHAKGGSWLSALALFAYAAGFSFAYINLSAATGALLLFGAVQTTMLGYGIWAGERLLPLQTAGLILALAGLVSLLLPGLSAPPLFESALMLGAGVAWGIYSLRGRAFADPIRASAGNFALALPFAALLSVVSWGDVSMDAEGIWYAVGSGALASGLGYALWYSVLPALTATRAASLQLSVPVIAALGGVAFLDEPITIRLALASAAILGGIALVIFEKSAAQRA